MSISLSSKIFVAGHRGLIGHAVVEKLKNHGFTNIVTMDRKNLDLSDSRRVKEFFHSQKFDVVIIAAAKVGGIAANNTYRADFIFENLTIQNNLIWSAHLTDVERVIFLGSSCIYPREADQPIKESSLLTGPLEYTNRPYAIAKIAGLELIDSLRRQYHREYFSVMPTNLYGPYDNFNLENSHVLPALIRKFHEAKITYQKEVLVWGDGTPRREFLYSEDCADAIVFLLEEKPHMELSRQFDANAFSHINIGASSDITIRELAMTIADVVGFQGRLIFDTSKPGGTPRKLLDTSILHSLGWKAKTDLLSGIATTYSWFRENETYLRINHRY